MVKRQTICCYQSKRTKMLEKTVAFGKKRINEIFDIRASIMGLKKKDLMGTYDIATGVFQKNVFSVDVSELEPSFQEIVKPEVHSNVQKPLEITKRNTIVNGNSHGPESDGVKLEYDETKQAKTSGVRKKRDSVDIFHDEPYKSPRDMDENDLVGANGSANGISESTH